MKEKLTNLWNKYVNRETVSYLICGVLTTILNWAVYVVAVGFLKNTSVEKLAGSIANLIAWVIAVIFAFYVNKIFVFQTKCWHGKEFIDEFWKFIVARLLSLVFEEVFIWITVDLIFGAEAASPFFGISWSSIMKIVSSVFVMIMNYFASKFLIFIKKEEKQ